MMKKLFENWNRFLEENQGLSHVIVQDKNDPPKSGDEVIDSLVTRVLGALSDKDLKPSFLKSRSPECNPLTGHCFVASEAIWELIKSLESEDYYYTPCHMRKVDFPEFGPHWFLKDYNTGHIIDLTAGQFSSTPPYNDSKVRCDRKIDGEWSYTATALMMHRPEKSDEYPTGHYPKGAKIDRHNLRPTSRTRKLLKRLEDK